MWTRPGTSGKGGRCGDYEENLEVEGGGVVAGSGDLSGISEPVFGIWGRG